MDNAERVEDPFDPGTDSRVARHHRRAHVKVVQAMLGYATATMTLDRYGRPFPDLLDEVVKTRDAARPRVLAA
ncbi:hypothetical protein NE857_01385 [Nocardiopsis exhalans]|uniref:Uncharacterized protein n=1 Tax=Nocardiopsis exhalans TaxID=163604 RepID=A0ABY5D7K8_9ACTN|nr:hypothetical protein [Nocardiopsis exhalans]USY20344.1 hypothetical protein NE857_01385 [Nocardiopsis exhalans]